MMADVQYSHRAKYNLKYFDIISDDLFHCRNNSQDLIFTEHLQCSCERLRCKEKLGVFNDNKPPVCYKPPWRLFSFIWILLNELVTSAFFKETWKILRFSYIFRSFYEYIESSSQVSVIKSLCQPIVFRWCLLNKNINKQNLRCNRRSSSSSSSLLLLEWIYYLLVFHCFHNLLSPCNLPIILPTADACSTRPAPKPRPPRPVWAPEPNLPRENCTDDYAELFCLNGGTCFRSKYGDQFSIGCECNPGWQGRRCDVLETSNILMFNQQRVETASIASGVAVLVILLVFVSLLLYVYRRRMKIKSSGQCVSASAFEEPAHRTISDLPIRPFSVRRFDQLQSGRQSTDDVELGIAHHQSDSKEPVR